MVGRPSEKRHAHRLFFGQKEPVDNADKPRIRDRSQAVALERGKRDYAHQQRGKFCDVELNRQIELAAFLHGRAAIVEMHHAAQKRL